MNVFTCLLVGVQGIFSQQLQILLILREFEKRPRRNRGLLYRYIQLELPAVVRPYICTMMLEVNYQGLHGSFVLGGYMGKKSGGRSSLISHPVGDQLYMAPSKQQDPRIDEREAAA